MSLRTADGRGRLIALALDAVESIGLDRRRLVIVLLAVGLFTAASFPVPTAGPLATRAHAQTAAGNPQPDSRSGDDASRIDIRVPSVILAEPASEVALAVTLGPADRIPKNTLLRVRGLPTTAALSEGHAIAPGSWAVATSALPRLRILVPVGTAGKSDISLMLVTIDGSILAETRTSLVVGNAARLISPDMPAAARSTAAPALAQQTPPTASSATPAPPSQLPAAQVAPPPIPSPAPSPPARTAAVVAPPPPPPPPPATPPRTPDAPPSRPDIAARSLPVLTPEARARAQAMVQRGETLRQGGDIASARLFFERAAETGLPEAALALGATYDPHELAQLKVHGLRADSALARRWYERARELGHTEAATRLSRLGP